MSGRVLPLLLTSVVALSGCGEKAKRATVTRSARPTVPPNSGRALSEKEAFTVGVATATADVTCRDARIPESRVRTLIRRLIVLARRKPDDLGSAFGEVGQTPRSALARVIRGLRENDCSPAVAAEAQAAYRALPPP